MQWCPHRSWFQVNAMILPDVAAISRAIQETNPCTQPVFFLTWGKRDGDTQNCNNGNKFCTFDGVQDLLTQVLINIILSINNTQFNTQAYLSMAYVAQPASVAPAGEAWRSYSDRNSLFSGDGSHAQSAGKMTQYCPGSDSCGCQAPT